MIAEIKMTERGLLAQSERRLNHSVEDVWVMLTEWFQELQVGDLREGDFMKSLKSLKLKCFPYWRLIGLATKSVLNYIQRRMVVY